MKIPILENIKIFLASLPMTITPGKFGEVIKSYFLKVKYNYPISITAPIVLVERISDTIGMLILGVIGAILFNFGIRVLIVIIGITILGIVVLQSRSLCNLIINLINIIPFIRKYVPKIKSFYENTNNLLKARIIICAAIIGMVTWSFEGMVVYSAAKSVNINTSIIYSIFIQVFSSIVGAVSMLPGGVVASEGGILALLIKLGVQSGTAGFIILLVRFFTLWLGVIVGSIVLLKIEKEIEESGFDLSEINSDNNSKM